MPDTYILFRVTWDEHNPRSDTLHRKEQITDSLTEVQSLMVGLQMNIERYRNVKYQAAAVQWQDV